MAQCLSMGAVISITESEISVFHPSYECCPHLYNNTNTSILLCNTAQTLTYHLENIKLEKFKCVLKIPVLTK